MFFSGMLLWLVEHGWLMMLHLSARSSFPQPLAPGEEARLIESMLAGDNDAGRSLIEHNLRLVAHIVKKYANSGVDADDLISIGSIGLIKAVHTFKPESGRLASYASRCIENEILMCLRANRKNRGMIMMGESVGTDKDGNELTLADLLGTDPNIVPDEVENAIEAGRAMRLIGKVLDEREQQVLILRLGLKNGEPLPQHAVAKHLGISRSYV